MNRDEERDRSIADEDAVIIRETEVTVTSGDADTAEIRANIEQTRADLSETINAIQDRLSPANLKEQAQEQFQEVKEHVKDQVREQFYETKEMVREATIGRVENMMHSAGDTVNDARYTVMETIRQNPIPAALVGIGLSWLLMNRQSSSSQRVQISGRGSIRGGQQHYGGQQYYDDRGGYDRGYRPDYYADQRGGRMMQGGQGVVGNTVDRARSTASNVASSVSDTASNVASSVSDTASNVASSVSDTASNVASSVSDTASNVASSVSDTASNVAYQAQRQARRVEDTFQDNLQTNPLAVGAIALALGTAVGLALPQTERENELMGETRDSLVERAQEVASDTIGKVQRVASEAASEAKQTVQEQAREQGLTS